MQQFIGERGRSSEPTRTPSMTYVYGATLKGTADFLEEYCLTEKKVKFPESTDGKNTSYQYCLYAGRKLFYGIAATVPAASAAMQWLCDVAGSMPKGQRMEWRTPTGFLVQHDYRDSDVKEVFLRSCGLKVTLVSEWNDSTKPIEMRNAISPNFVHALDASHLTITANKMKDSGLAIVAIHDSFGTHMGDIDKMHEHIRASFVELYKGRNLLAEFLWEVGGTGETPLRGNFELDNVLSSEFFFC